MTPHVGREAMEQRPRRTHRASTAISILVFASLLVAIREPELRKHSFLRGGKVLVFDYPPGREESGDAWVGIADWELDGPVKRRGGPHQRHAPRPMWSLLPGGGVLRPRSARWNIATPILLHGLGVPVALRLMLPANLLLRILQLHLPTGMKIRRSTVDDKLLLKNFENNLRAAVERRQARRGPKVASATEEDQNDGGAQQGGTAKPASHRCKL